MYFSIYVSLPHLAELGRCEKSVDGNRKSGEKGGFEELLAAQQADARFGLDEDFAVFVVELPHFLRSGGDVLQGFAMDLNREIVGQEYIDRNVGSEN